MASPRLVPVSSRRSRSAPAASPRTPVTQPAAIETTGLSKRYGPILAVDGLTMRVPQGGVTGFVGPNGAGKTTTIRMLLGLVKPSGGSASVLGHDIAEPSAFLPRVGALVEAPAFYPPLSGRRNLEVIATLGGHEERRIGPVLSMVGLAERADDPYRTYSLGMKQRLAIAAALLPDPQLLVLDEPTNGLDPAGIREVRDLLQDLGRSGKTVFVSSHLMAEVQRLCDHLVVIGKGKLIYQGTLDELLARQAVVIARARDANSQKKLVELVLRSGKKAQTEGDQVLVHAPASWAAELTAIAMRAGIVLTEIRTQSGDLEETILAMTGKGAL